MHGGLRSATILAAIAEDSPGGPCRIVLQFGMGGGARKPLAWRGDAACLDAAELVVEEQLPAFCDAIAEYLRLPEGWRERDLRSGIHPSKLSGFESYAE